MVKWFLVKALENNFVNGVIQVRQTNDPNSLFEYYIAKSQDEIRSGAKSAYYPTNFAKVIKQVLDSSSEERFAFVGLPCFCHSIRLLQKQYPKLKKQIPLVVSIFCGHLKSKHYSYLMAMQSGLKDFEDPIKNVDFRLKTDSDKNASQYNFISHHLSGDIFSKKRTSISGGDWKIPHLKVKACDFCEDVFANTADIVFGDAWMKPFFNDPLGSNLVIIRSKASAKIFHQNLDEIYIKKVDVNAAIRSQGGSYNHRVRDIHFRLEREKQVYGWAPKKRARDVDKPTLEVKDRRNKIQLLRTKIRAESRELFKAAKLKKDLSIYTKGIDSLVNQIKKLY